MALAAEALPSWEQDVPGSVQHLAQFLLVEAQVLLTAPLLLTGAHSSI